MKHALIFFSIFCFTLALTRASDTINLPQTILANDSLLFQLGFNQCDLNQFEKLVSSNFEFYHDKSGMTNSKEAFIHDIKTNICQAKHSVRRKLIGESTRIDELKDNGQLYGAIQSGIHEFYSTSSDNKESLTSTAKFIHVWILENGNWKLGRALSFDHQDKDLQKINWKLLFKDRDETEKWLDELNVPALGIGYISNGHIQNTSVFGEIYKGQPADSNTIFNVASLAKPITAIVTLKLVNQGSWNLDSPLAEHYIDPDIKEDSRTQKITTRHVLSHRTGFPNWRYENENGKLTFDFEPGSKYQYSGEGFEYLRKALESKFDRSLNELAKELVFGPLNMENTRFYWDETMDESKFAKWHDGEGNVYKTTKNKTSNAADDLLTTVSDYCRFLEHVMNGAGLTPELYDEMLSVQSRVKENQHFGLGWLIDENIGENAFAITHGGDDIGVHAIVFMVPHSNEGLVIFTNSDNGTQTYIETILHYLKDRGQGIIDVETN